MFFPLMLAWNFCCHEQELHWAPTNIFSIGLFDISTDAPHYKEKCVLLRNEGVPCTELQRLEVWRLFAWDPSTLETLFSRLKLWSVILGLHKDEGDTVKTWWLIQTQDQVSRHSTLYLQSVSTTQTSDFNRSGKRFMLCSILIEWLLNLGY